MIVALCGQKGGTGKTTTAIAIASEWFDRGKKVLLVDVDPQQSTRTWGHIAAEQDRSTPTIIAVGSGFHRPGQLPDLARNYEHVVLDCPPRHGELQRSALMVADVAILPCGPQSVDAWALVESLDLIKEAQVIRSELRAAILVTRQLSRTSMGKGAREALREAGIPLLRTELCARVAYAEALAAGQGITQYARKSAAADEVRRLVDEIEEMGEEEHGS